eukprot:Awhi_evm1s9398
MAPNNSNIFLSSDDQNNGHVNSEEITSKNWIKLVGAGPGDPDLLTIKAYKALMEADLVVTDYLVPQDLLDVIPKKTQIKTAVKQQGRSKQGQIDIMNWCLDGLKENKNVVRLKNGDPFLYGRGREEQEFFLEHGFIASVIPGISSSLAAPVVSNIPVTHRGTADQVLICTGHGKDDTYPLFPPYNPKRTLILLMSVTRIEELVNTLIEKQGYPADIGVSIIERASFPDQRLTHASLENIAAIAKERGVKAPANIVIGSVTELPNELYR